MPLRSKRFSGNFRVQKAANNSPPMRKGETGEAVQILQQALVDLDFPMPITTGNGTKPCDGIYGSETAGTVSKFQTRHGLSIDGIAGRQTFGRLDQIFFEREEEERKLRLPPCPRDWSVTTARHGN